MNVPAVLNDLTMPWVDRSVEDRLFWIEQDHWVNTPTTQVIYQWLEYLLRSQRRLRPVCLQIIAAAGMGKTAMLLAFLAAHPVIRTEDPLRLERPVVLANATGVGTGVDGLRSAIMKGLWPDAKNHHAQQMTLDASLIAQKVRLLLVDETGELLMCGPAGHKRMLAELKRLTNELRINIASATVEGLDHVLRSDPQLDSRFKRKIRIERWTESQDLRNFVYGLENFLPFPERSYLDSETSIRWFMRYTSGNTEAITGLIRLASQFALGKRHRFVSPEDFELARTSATPPPILLPPPVELRRSA